ncbi:MAG: ubiquinone/menaquinone biosynthesis methyltransferase [Verrucomicrobiota bacterium]
MNTTPDDIRQMFTRIAGKYDFFNRFFSFGLEAQWRKILIRGVLKHAPRKVLDLATGTGKIALPLQKAGLDVTGVDFCAEMLDIAQFKGLKNTVLADITNLPFSDSTFDAVTIGFAMRNLEKRRLEALQEMHRVLKPGGYLYVLEFSRPHSFIRPFFYFYLKHIMPWVVYGLTRQKKAYDYLATSIETFLDQQQFCDLLRQAGFRDISYQNLAAGAVALHQGMR